MKKLLTNLNKQHDVGCVGFANLQPKSSGFVKLSSVSDRPRINTNFLSHPDDLEMMFNRMKIQIRIVAMAGNSYSD